MGAGALIRRKLIVVEENSISFRQVKFIRLNHNEDIVEIGVKKLTWPYPLPCPCDYRGRFRCEGGGRERSRGRKEEGKAYATDRPDRGLRDTGFDYWHYGKPSL